MHLLHLEPPFIDPSNVLLRHFAGGLRNRIDGLFEVVHELLDIHFGVFLAVGGEPRDRLLFVLVGHEGLDAGVFGFRLAFLQAVDVIDIVPHFVLFSVF